MSFHEWVLTDVDRRWYVEDWSITSQDLGIAVDLPFSVHKKTLRGGLSDGVDIIEVNNGVLTYSILPTRGMGIWRGDYRGTMLGWKSPVRGPVNPAFVDPEAYGGIGWITGFDEWIVRCGLSSNGPPGVDVFHDDDGAEIRANVTLHGPIANVPAFYVAVRIGKEPPHAIEVVGKVEESCLFMPQLQLDTTIRTTPGANRFTLHDVVTNRRSTPAEMELLYHCNFGAPLMSEHGRFLAPIRTLAPRDDSSADEIDRFASYPAPAKTPIGETAYFAELHGDAKTGKTLALLQNGAGDKGCALRFSKKQLPWFTLWKHPASEGDGYVTGLEPAINFPNLRTFERKMGRVAKLPGGASYETEIEFEIADDALGVDRLITEIAALQSLAPPTILKNPKPEFSPG